jgi:hypothetical protein
MFALLDDRLILFFVIAFFYSFLFNIHVSLFASCCQQLSYLGAIGHKFLLSLNATFEESNKIYLLSCEIFAAIY